MSAPAGGDRSPLRAVSWRRGERGRLALSVALAAGAAAAAIALLSTSGYLISRAAQRPQILMLMVAIVAVRGLGIARATLRYGERLASHDLALRRLARLRGRFYSALVPLVPGSLAGRSGDVLSRFVADVDALMDLDLRAAIPATVAACVVAGASLAAWLMLPSAGVVVLASLGSAAAALTLLGYVAFARAARRQAPARAVLTSELIEGIDGARELALAGRSADHAARIAAADARLARISRSDALAGAASSGAGGVLAAAGLIALLCVCIPAVHSGALSGVLLAAIAFLLLAAFDSVLPLPGAARALRTCRVAAARLQEVELADAGVRDPAVPASLSGLGDLALDGVTFRYAPGEPLILDGARLTVGSGEHVALMGDSGAGKSTIADLLVRFRDPTCGAVRIDGIDVRELAQRELRSAVLLCAQDCHVFNTSIRENLLLARREASDDQIERALDAVELSRWAGNLPDGLDTILGQDGELVSGGQRTRIALARALLSDARFVILDEPTAHLDAPLARRVMASVLHARAGRALLVITHDPEVLEGFDRVVRLHRGVIAAGPRWSGTTLRSSGAGSDSPAAE